MIGNLERIHSDRRKEKESPIRQPESIGNRKLFTRYRAKRKNKEEINKEDTHYKYIKLHMFIKNHSKSNKRFNIGLKEEN